MNQFSHKLSIVCSFLLLLLTTGLHAQVELPTNTAWKNINTTATDISIAGDNKVFILNQDGELKSRSTSDNTWKTYPGSLNRISVTQSGEPWGVDAQGIVYQFARGTWLRVGAGATDIAAVSDEKVYVTTNTGSLAVFNSKTSQWSVIKGNGFRLAAAPNGELWTVARDGAIARFLDNTWIGVIGLAIDISVSVDGKVVMLGQDGQLYEWKDSISSWQVINNTQNSNAVAAGKDDVLLRSNEQNQLLVYGLNFNESAITETPSSGSPGGSTDAEETIDPVVSSLIEFGLPVGQAEDISIGSEGSIYVRLADDSLQRWSNTERRFNLFPGELKRLAVSPQGLPWGIGKNNSLFRHDGSIWKEVPLNLELADLSIASNGTVLLTDTRDRVYSLSDSLQTFTRLKASGQQVAASSEDDVYWLVDSSQRIFRCEQAGDCVRKAGSALDIDIGPGNSVYIVDQNNSLRRYNVNTNLFELAREGRTSKVALGPGDKAWIIDTENNVLPTEFFRRDESGDRALAALTENTADITEVSAIELITTPNFLSATHTVGTTICPQVIGTINNTLSNGQAFTLSNINVAGGLEGVIDTNVVASNNNRTQDLSVSFNCSDATAGIRTGSITATATDTESGLTTTLSIPVTLNVVIDTITLNATPNSINVTHSVGIDSCPQLIGSIDTSLTNGNAFSVSNINVDGNLTSLVDIVVTPNGSAATQDIQVNFNCSDLTPAQRNGNLTATITDDITTATTTLLVPISLEVLIEPITITATPNILTASHTVGTTVCPQLIGSVSTELTNGNAFSLSSVFVDGDLVGLVDVVVTPNGSSESQSLAVNFNCSDISAGLRNGNIMATVTDDVSGATTNLSVPVSLDIIVEPIFVTLSPTTINATHVFGTDACPNTFGTVNAVLTNSNNFILSNIAVDGDLLGVVDPVVTPNGAANSQDITLSFNCSSSVGGIRNGNVTADVTDEITGASTTLSIPVTLDVTPPPVMLTLTPLSLNATHSVGISSCPQLIGTVNTSLTSGDTFTLSNLSVDGGLTGVVDVTVTPDGSAASQDLAVSFNCSDATAGLRNGNVTADVTNDVTGAMSSLTIPVSLEVIIPPITITASPISLTATHSVGVTSCPQLIGTVSTSLDNGDNFTLSNLIVDGGLDGVVNVTVTPDGSAASQDLAVNFNCSDLSVGIRTGNITADVTDDDTGATTTLSIPVNLTVAVDPITLTLSPTSITEIHTVGVSSCPQVLDTVTATLTNGNPFTVTGVSVDGALDGVVDVTVTPDGSAASQDVVVSFNCSDATAGTRTGNVTAMVTDDVTGATTMLSIPVSLEVIIPPITITASPISLTATHSVGVTSCPQLIGTVSTGLDNGDNFTLSNLMVDGGLDGVVDVTVAPDGSAASQDLAVNFNCSDLSVGIRTGSITADVTDDDTGATTTLSIPVNLTVAVDPITLTLSPTSLTATHDVGVTSCPQVLGTVTASLTNGSPFTLSTVSVDGGLIGVVDVAVTPNGSAVSQDLAVSFNCSDASAGTRTGNVTAMVTDDVTGATTMLSIPVSLEVIIPPITITATPISLTATHSVGVSSCPQLLGTVNTALDNGDNYTLSNVVVDGGLVGVVDVTVTPDGSATSQDLAVNFNCSDLSVGIRTGNITADVTDDDTGATTTLSIPVNLTVAVDPITLTLSPTSITETHTVGMTSCPQVLGTVTASLTNGNPFTLSTVSVDGGLTGVVDVAVTPDGSAASQDLAVSFNCSDATAGIRTGNVTAMVTDDVTGATTMLSIPVSLDVIVPPLNLLVSPSLVSQIHNVGTESCPQLLETVMVQLDNDQDIELTGVAVDGDLVGVIDVVVTPNGVAVEQSLAINFNCSDLSVGTRTGNVTALVTNVITGGTTNLSVPVSLDVVIPPAMLTLTPNSLSEIHTVGTSTCPQVLGNVNSILVNGNAFTLSNIAVDGTLVGVIDVVDLQPGSATAHNLAVSFNCSDATAGLRSGSITADVTDDISGATTTFSIPVTLDVIVPPVNVLLTETSLTATHNVGIDPCPQLLGSVIAQLDNSDNLEISDVAADGDLAGIVDVVVTPGGIDVEHELAISFNCSDTTTGTLNGNVTALVTNDVTGGTANLSIPVSLDVVNAFSGTTALKRGLNISAPTIANGQEINTSNSRTSSNRSEPDIDTDNEDTSISRESLNSNQTLSSPGRRVIQLGEPPATEETPTRTNSLNAAPVRAEEIQRNRLQRQQLIRNELEQEFNREHDLGNRSNRRIGDLPRINQVAPNIRVPVTSVSEPEETQSEPEQTPAETTREDTTNSDRPKEPASRPRTTPRQPIRVPRERNRSRRHER